MLRVMDELEKCVDDLLNRLRNNAGLASDSGGERPAGRDERGKEEELQAAELIRRAIKRLKSL